MNTTQLECFVEVANCLNFSRAAERLSMTQPAVSHQINALENELGIKLFHRTSKSVRLTQEGFSFSQYAGEILKLENLSRARMKESGKRAPMRLIIGCRNTAELRMLRPALSEFRPRHPKVFPVIKLIPFDSVENLLMEGDIHLLFSFRESAPSRARYQELALCPAVCICSPSHPLAMEESVSLELLQTEERIAICRPPACPTEIFSIQTQAVGNRETSRIFFCDNQETMMPLVEAGYAFAVVADFHRSRLWNVRYLPIRGIDPLSFGAVYLPERCPPFFGEFISLLRETLAVPEKQEENG